LEVKSTGDIERYTTAATVFEESSSCVDLAFIEVDLNTLSILDMSMRKLIGWF